MRLLDFLASPPPRPNAPVTSSDVSLYWQIVGSLAVSIRGKASAAGDALATSISRSGRLTFAQVYQQTITVASAAAGPGGDLDAMCFVVTVNASADLDAALQALINQLNPSQLNLQQALSQKSQFEETFSNMLKTFGDTASGIISNIKN